MKSLKSKVFTIAHQIKSFFASWSQALKAAWRIAKMMLGKITTIEFAKSTGEVRTAQIQRIASLKKIGQGVVGFIEQLRGDELQYRSFRVERLIIN